MLATILGIGLFLAQAPAAPTTVPAATTQPAPTTQQVIVVTTATNETTNGLLEQLTGTKLGRVVTGQQTLTLNEVKNPAFWIDSVKDLVLTVLAFIPRFLG